jgi:DNA-binding transcriptional regulator GbsR (MarR family)
MKWKQTLDGFGLTEETVSQGIRNKIKDYYTIVDGIEELEKSIQNPTLNDDVDELKNDLEELQEALEEQDKVLVKAVTMFDKNKEHYAKLSQNLVGRGRPKKDAQQQTQPNVAQTTTQTKAQPNVQNVAGNVTQEEKPKKTNIALWVVGIVIGGLIGVNILKNRE